MKRILSILVVVCILVSFTTTAFAEKPVDRVKENGAETYSFNLSGSVMPVPPYGLQDIVGSEVDSKLIVNLPEGGILATVTGVMKGLVPSETYTVYISNGYEPFVEWIFENNYTFTFVYSGLDYVHYYTITDRLPDGTWVGTGYSGVHTELIKITIDGNNVTFITQYLDVPTYIVTANFVIGTGGVLLNGSWTSTTNQSGTVEANRPLTAVGDKGWSGYLNSVEYPSFTFTADEFGNGSWHINLKDEAVVGKTEFSVWINHGATILISDNVPLQ